MNSMEGTLFRYGPSTSNLAFIAGRGAAEQRGGRYVALVAGLTEGLLSLCYSVPLADALRKTGWTLVMVQLHSSYQGYGVASLDQDAAEMLMLSRALASDYEAAGIVFMGHSTGCQDTVRFMQRHVAAGGATPLLGTVLQASSSDREWLAQHPELLPVLERAQEMVAQGRGEEVVTRFSVLCDKAPVCARRLASWMLPGGDDDHFSSDLSDEALEAILRPVGQRPCLLLVSGDDETVPPGVDLLAHAARLAAAVGPSATLVVVPGAPHQLEGHEEEGVAHVMTFLETLGDGKRRA